jgi:hypothetical protein
MMAPSAREHRERMERGTNAVRGYLRSQFPGSSVEVLERTSRDSERRRRTFKVRTDSEEHLLRVADEVIDFDATGVGRHLEQLKVAQALRDAGRGNAVLITTDAIREEPISG